MPYHFAAFAGSALDASAGDVKVNAVTDEQFRINNNNFVFGSGHKILAAYAAGVGLLRARLNTPRFRIPSFPQIKQVNEALIVADNSNWLDLRDNPYDIYGNEELSLEGTNGAANTIVGFVCLGSQDWSMDLPPGDWRWIRFTSTPSSLALAWSARGELVFQDSLDSGIYEVGGCYLHGTTHHAHRLIFNNQAMRPGAIGGATAGIKQPAMFDGGLGIWGTFENSTPPGLQVFNTAAGVASFIGMLLVRYVGR